MKKAMIALVALLMFMSVTALAEGVDLSVMTDSELRQLRTDIDTELSDRQAASVTAGGVISEGDIGDFHVSIISIVRSTNYKDEPAVVVTYLFANNGQDEGMFMTEVSDKLYQNGVQIENGISVDGADSQSQMTNIKPGASIEVTAGYLLSDTTSPIDIELGKLIDFSSNPEKLIVTVAVPD